MLIKLTAGYRLDFGQIARIASFLNMPENEKLAGKQIADQLGISRARLGRLWMMARALGLGTKGIWKLTDLGKVIIEYDPYLDDIGTLWLLHFVISSDPDILVWNKMINHVFPENHHVNMSIAKPYFEDALADFSVASYEQHLNKEIQSFFDAYTGQHFENLGYMLEEEDKNYRLTPSQSIPPHILGASILIYRERFAPNVATLDINTLAQTDNSPGRIFALTQRQLRDLLENIKNKGYIFVESRADLDQIRFRDDIYPIDTIQRYYEER